MSANDDNGPVRITNREIWEKLEKQDERWHEVSEKLALLVDKFDSLTTVKEDHEQRLRNVEKRITQIVAIGSVVALVIGPAVGAVLGHYL